MHGKDTRREDYDESTQEASLGARQESQVMIRYPTRATCRIASVGGGEDANIHKERHIIPAPWSYIQKLRWHNKPLREAK